MTQHNEPITYAGAGVDVEAGDKAVELMKASVKQAQRPEVLGGLGGPVTVGGRLTAPPGGTTGWRSG